MQTCIVGIVVNSGGLFYTPICQELGFGRGELALYITFSNLTSMVLLPLWGSLIKKYPIKLLCAFSLIMDSLGLFLMSIGKALWYWYLGGMLMGIGNALLMMLVTPVLLSNWFEKNLGMVTGIAMSFSGIGGPVMNPICAKMIENLGWRTTQGIIALVPVVIVLPYVLLVYRLTPEEMGVRPYGAGETQATQTALSGGFTQKQAMKSVMFVLIIVLAMLVSFGASYPNYLSSIADSLGHPLTFGATLVSLSMVGNVVGKLVLGSLNDKLGVKGSMTVGICGLIFSYLCMMASIQTGATILLVVGSATTGFAMSVGAVMLPLVTRAIFGNRDYSSIYSYVSMGSSFSIAISGAAVGFIFDTTGSYLVSFGIGVVVYALAVLCLMQLFAIKKKTPDPVQ